MKKLSSADLRALACVSLAMLVTLGTAGCRTAPVALQPKLQLRPDAEGKAGTPAVPTADAPPKAASLGIPSKTGSADTLLSLETATPSHPVTNGKSRAARPAPAPKVSRPLPSEPSTVATRQPVVEPPEDAWDVVALDTHADDRSSGWTTAARPTAESKSTESIQLTGHETAPAQAPPRLAVPRGSGRVPVPATRQVGATAAASSGQPACDDCLPALNDWKQQLQEQTEALSEKVDLLEDELKASREALKTVNAALENSNRELSRLSNDVRYWQGEVKRIETVMEQQHQQDIKSLDALSATLEQFVRDDDQTSQSASSNQNRPQQ